MDSNLTSLGCGGKNEEKTSSAATSKLAGASGKFKHSDKVWKATDSTSPIIVLADAQVQTEKLHVLELDDHRPPSKGRSGQRERPRQDRRNHHMSGAASDAFAQLAGSRDAKHEAIADAIRAEKEEERKNKKEKELEKERKEMERQINEENAHALRRAQVCELGWKYDHYYPFCHQWKTWRLALMRLIGKCLPLAVCICACLLMCLSLIASFGIYSHVDLVHRLHYNEEVSYCHFQLEPFNHTGVCRFSAYRKDLEPMLSKCYWCMVDVEGFEIVPYDYLDPVKVFFFIVLPCVAIYCWQLLLYRRFYGKWLDKLTRREKWRVSFFRYSNMPVQPADTRPDINGQTDIKHNDPLMIYVWVERERWNMFRGKRDSFRHKQNELLISAEMLFQFNAPKNVPLDTEYDTIHSRLWRMGQTYMNTNFDRSYMVHGDDLVANTVLTGLTWVRSIRHYRPESIFRNTPATEPFSTVTDMEKSDWILYQKLSLMLLLVSLSVVLFHEPLYLCLWGLSSMVVRLSNRILMML